MSEIGHQEGEGEPVSRRYFFELVGCGAMAITAMGGGIFTWQFLSPNVLFEPPMAFRAGRPSDYVPGTVTLHPAQKTYVVRQEDGTFYAMSAVCTHLGCITAWKPERGVVACPCHGSVFSRDGEVQAGPAPRPLSRFLVTLTDRGELMVDRGVIVGQDQVLKV